MTHFKILELPTFEDTRGALTVLENALPFEVKRMYWIYSADGQVRGGHRHQHTRQALISVNGQISIYMNDGVAEEIVSLDQPSKCLIVEAKDWHTMTFSKGSVLLVLSSHLYDLKEYIDTPYESVIND